MDSSNSARPRLMSDVEACRHHHGQPVGLGGHARRRRDAGGARRRLRRADRLRPSHPRPAGRLRQGREGRRLQGHHRRRGRRRASARHDRGHDPASGVRRAGPFEGAHRAWTASCPSSRCRPASRSARSRSAKPGAVNAALLAAAVLALGDEKLAARLEAWRAKRTAEVAERPDDARRKAETADR